MARMEGKGPGGLKGAKKRAASDDEGNMPRASKKSKADDEDDTAPVPPKWSTDAEGNQYIALNTSGKRRVTVSPFKGKVFVNIREYYEKDGEWKPGSKGMTMTIQQYNTLLGAAPLLEAALAKQDIQVTRPDYDADVDAATETPKEEDVGAEDGDEDNDKETAAAEDERDAEYETVVKVDDEE